MDLFKGTNEELLKKLQELDEEDSIKIKIPENLNESVMKYNGYCLEADNIHSSLFKKVTNFMSKEYIDMYESVKDNLNELYKFINELEQQILIETLSEEIFQYVNNERLNCNIYSMVNFIEILKPSYRGPIFEKPLCKITLK